MRHAPRWTIKRSSIKRSSILTLVAVLCWVTLTPVKWASAQQQAYVVISTTDGSRGCGVLVGESIVLTAWHVLREGGQPTCFFPRANKAYRGRVLASDAENDLAVIRIAKTEIEPMPVADFAPTPGDTVWLLGRPGGSGDRRTVAKVLPYHRQASPKGAYLLSWSPEALAGESGGPVNSYRGLVGILSAASHGQSCGANNETIKARLTQWCPGGICTPSTGHIYSTPSSRRQIYASPSPATTSPRPVQPTPTVRIDYDELAQAIIKAGGRGPAGVDGQPGTDGVDGLVGPPGPQGEPGLAGRDITVDLDALVSQVLDRLPPITVNIMGRDGPAQTQIVRLGEEITIPPVILTKLQGGETYQQIKPLGEAIRFELVPRRKTQ